MGGGGSGDWERGNEIDCAAEIDGECLIRFVGDSFGCVVDATFNLLEVVDKDRSSNFIFRLTTVGEQSCLSHGMYFSCFAAVLEAHEIDGIIV